MRHKNVMERKIRLKTVNPHIICFLCKGYLIDATTITECLHTFCKTCIVKHLNEHTSCPRCEIVIHQSHPKNFLSHDRTMQDIVYKLVPNLQDKEIQRQKDFYQKRGLPLPRSLSVNEETEQNSTTENTSSNPDDRDHHINEEQVNLFLECINHSNHLKNLKRKFIRCSVHTTITHLKKYIAFKVYSKMDRYKDIDILCNAEILGKDHTLKFICVTRWRVKDVPLKLQFRPKVEL